MQASPARPGTIDRTPSCGYCEIVKNITVSVSDDAYHAARIEAARRRTSVSALVREFLQQLTAADSDSARNAWTSELERLWALSDRRDARRRGSVGPLNREGLYKRGVH